MTFLVMKKEILPAPRSWEGVKNMVSTSILFVNAIFIFNMIKHSLYVLCKK